MRPYLLISYYSIIDNNYSDIFLDSRFVLVISN